MSGSAAGGIGGGIPSGGPAWILLAFMEYAPSALFVVLVFFSFDLARLRPLSTPLALSARLIVPMSPLLDRPVISRAFSVAVFAGGLIIFTLAHFLAFATLGVCAVWGCAQLGIPLNTATGAFFGLLVGTVAFFGCMALAGIHIPDAPLGIKEVAGANLAAGMVMGGFASRKRLRL